MYYFLALLSGVLLTVMLAVNGGLAVQYGLHWATAFIHVTGLGFSGIWVLAKRERPFASLYPWFWYLSGAIGVFITVCKNFAFGRISVSAILALALLGQIITGLVVDHWGLWGMPRRPISRGNLAGLALILCGIVPLLTDFEAAAVAASFAAGGGTVAARTFSARLAGVAGVQVSTFFNYLIGLSLALPVFFIFGGGETPLGGITFSSEWYIYIGGLLGVGLIATSNIIVPKMAAFYLTLLLFIGQVFAGIIIDAVLDGAFSIRIFLGGILVAAGLGANFLLDRRKRKRDEPLTNG